MSSAPAQAPISDANPTVEAMKARVARFRALRPAVAGLSDGHDQRRGPGRIDWPAPVRAAAAAAGVALP